MSEKKTALDLACELRELWKQRPWKDGTRDRISDIDAIFLAIPADATEQLKARDARIADITSQRDLVQRAYNNCQEKAEARVKELEEHNRSLTTALQYAND